MLSLFVLGGCAAPLVHPLLHDRPARVPAADLQHGHAGGGDHGLTVPLPASPTPVPCGLCSGILFWGGIERATGAAPDASRLSLPRSFRAPDAPPAERTAIRGPPFVS